MAACFLFAIQSLRMSERGRARFAALIHEQIKARLVFPTLLGEIYVPVFTGCLSHKSVPPLVKS